MTLPLAMAVGSNSAVIILMFNTICVFSQISHELVYFVGCFVNGTIEVQFEFDNEEIYYADFQKPEIIYTVPVSIDPDPSLIWTSLKLQDTLDNKENCLFLAEYLSFEKKNPPEQRDPPESMLFPAEEVQLGVENTLICFMNHFYPPSINVSWTKNGHPVSEGVSLGRYYPNKDQTFHQFSTLTFTPSEGDIYSCTVEHSALQTPNTRIWEPDISDEGPGPAVFCGVGLTVGLLMFAAGVFLIVKAQNR